MKNFALGVAQFLQRERVCKRLFMPPSHFSDSRKKTSVSTPSRSGGGTFLLIGGFLGAGKTTCLGGLTRLLQGRGKRVGLITNDQGTGLVDTQTSKLEGSSLGSSSSRDAGEKPMVREITGGCFCCRADELAGALKEMQAGEDKPDVFIAEPVGSCTDLVATVLLPLEQNYGQTFRRAPMSVVIDAKRAWGHYFGTGRAAGNAFSKDVAYIYLKQLEEAELLVVNKLDLLKQPQQEKLLARLALDWPEKRMLSISARSGEGCEAWLDLLLGEETQPKTLMEVDYERYAVGEALMGWFNAKLRVEVTGKTVDGNKLLLKPAREIQKELEAGGAELAHFKMSLECGTGLPPVSHEPLVGKAVAVRVKGLSTVHGLQARATLAVVNAVRNGDAAELSRRMEGGFTEAELLVNLRAEADPSWMDEVVTRHLNTARRGLKFTWLDKASFRPGKPQPTHRVTALKKA